MNADLRLALELADAADAITMQWFQSSSLAVRTKIDMTPVSEADEAVERTLRERLAAARPGDAVVGEEYGSAGTSSRRWILDPIDATKNYVRGILAFATLIALEENGTITVAVVSAPALARRWWASKGEGAFCNGRKISVSRIGAMSDALVTYDSVTDFDQHGGTDAFLSLVRSCGRARGFGDFWAHMLVAEGAADIAIEPAVATWDVAPVQLIVEEAGGRFTDLRGNARYDGGSALSTNGLLHDSVLELFTGAESGERRAERNELPSAPPTEQVMVVERERIARFLVERGLVQERTEEMLDIIIDRHFFLDRPSAEVSPQYKQIIPYVVIRRDGAFFLLQRTQKQTEARLHDKLSLGIGGHINPDTPDLLDGLQKELEEEVHVEGDYELSFVGILNDDTTEVGSVHLGAVYVLDVQSGDVTVRETEKMSGRWVPREELAQHRDRMETWSQIVYDAVIA